MKTPFWKNWIGNCDETGVFAYSTKKIWFNVTAVLALIVPLILLVSGRVTGLQFMDYMKWILPTTGVIYAYGRKNEIGSGGSV